jgi:hypothetical protein
MFHARPKPQYEGGRMIALFEAIMPARKDGADDDRTDVGALINTTRKGQDSK